MLNWVISVLSFCLLGARIAAVPTPCHVVTQITVLWTEDETDFRRVYSDPEKLNKVLLYLRTLKPQSPTRPPEAPMAPEYTIFLECSDGATVHYTQYGLTCLRKGDGGLQVIDPEKSIRLPLILAAVPGDSDF